MPRISRRDFLKMVGAGGVGASAGFLFAESKKQAVEFLVPQVEAPEDFTPGIATWYSSVCRQCDAGCGIMVRTREGRAKKIEGNPNHPLNQGKLCAHGQAGLNGLYNPDRIRTPLRRVGEKGSGNFEAISWDEAMGTVVGALQTVIDNGAAGNVHIVSGNLRGHVDKLVADFAAALGTDNYGHFDFHHPGNLYAANKLAFDEERLPYYDIENTDFLLSLGADFLNSWISPVHHSLGLGRMRQGGAHRGYFVQVEPRMSMSAAAADEWLPARPGSEGFIALAIAHTLLANGRYQGADAPEWQAALADYTPAAAAARSDLSEAQIKTLAQQFAAANTPLAIGGGSAANGVHGQSNLLAVNILNYLAGSLGRKGGIVLNPAPVLDAPSRAWGFAGMRQRIERANRGEIPILFVHGTNPAFSLPRSAGFKAALANVGTVVAMSSFLDETTALADIVLPLNSYLESWGDDIPAAGVGFPVASISQPVVKPLYDTRDLSEVFLFMGQAISADFATRYPWKTARDFVRGSWRKLYDETSGLAASGSFEEFWQSVLRAGVWGTGGGKRYEGKSISPALLQRIVFTDDVADSAWPFSLQPYVSPSLGDGRGANLPWLQELPDPLSGIVYTTWVEINPVTAREMGIREGDVVSVKSASGSIEAPAFLFPGIRPDVIAIPIGQGHDEFGRYAKNRGANPLGIVDLITDKQSGELAWGATRVSIATTGERVRLIKQSGVPRELGRNITG